MGNTTSVNVAEVKAFGIMSAEFFCNVEQVIRTKVLNMSETDRAKEKARITKRLSELYSVFPELVNSINKSIIGLPINVDYLTGKVRNGGISQEAQLAVLLQMEKVLSKDEGTIGKKMEELLSKMTILSGFLMKDSKK